MDVSDIAARRLELEGPKPINPKLRSNPALQLAADRGAKTNDDVNRRAHDDLTADRDAAHDEHAHSDHEDANDNTDLASVQEEGESWEDGEHHVLDVRV